MAPPQKQPTSQAAPRAQEKSPDETKKPGELKIKHDHPNDDELSPEQVHTVRIDRDGNLSFDKEK